MATKQKHQKMARNRRFDLRVEAGYHARTATHRMVIGDVSILLIGQYPAIAWNSATKEGFISREGANAVGVLDYMQVKNIKLELVSHQMLIIELNRLLHQQAQSYIVNVVDEEMGIGEQE